MQPEAFKVFEVFIQSKSLTKTVEAKQSKESGQEKIDENRAAEQPELQYFAAYACSCLLDWSNIKYIKFWYIFN